MSHRRNWSWCGKKRLRVSIPGGDLQLVSTVLGPMYNSILENAHWTLDCDPHKTAHLTLESSCTPRRTISYLNLVIALPSGPHKSILCVMSN